MPVVGPFGPCTGSDTNSTSLPVQLFMSLPNSCSSTRELMMFNTWPALPGKTASAGPFYLVWQDPERSAISSEQWPYQLASLTEVESPAHRWPQIVVDSSLPSDAPARRGQAVFTTQCLPCHRMKGGGAAVVGPDLGQPMNPVQYFTPKGLRGVIRDPKAVRTWPQQQMPGFDATMIGDADLDALIAYLAHMRCRPTAASCRAACPNSTRCSVADWIAVRA